MYEFYCMMIILYEFNCSMTTFNCLLFCCSSREKKAPKKQGSALARLWFWEKHSQQSGLAARGLTYRHPQPSAEESVWGGEHSKQGLKGRRSGGAKLGTHKDTQTERCEGQLKDQTGPGEEGVVGKRRQWCEQRKRKESWQVWEESWEGKKSMERETRKEGKKDEVETFWVRWEPTLSLEPRGTRVVKRKMERQKKKKGVTPLPPTPPSPTLSPATKGIFVLGSWVCGNNLPNIENKWSVGSEFSPMLLQRKHSGSSQQGLTINQQFAHWSAEGGGRGLWEGAAQSKAGENRKSINTARQSKLQSEEFKSQQIREGYYLDEGIFTYDNIYSREKYSTHNRRYVCETFEKGPNAHERPQNLSKRRANLGNYSSQSGNNLRDMLMMETVQKVKCWILNETTKWNWLNLSSSGIWEPGLIPYMKCDLFTCMKPSSWMCMTKSNNSPAAIW